MRVAFPFSAHWMDAPPRQFLAAGLVRLAYGLFYVGVVAAVLSLPAGFSLLAWVLL